MESIFIYLYPLVVINGILGYVPQIIRLLKTDDVESISLSSWGIWIFGSAISMGYGIYHLKDFMFCVATGVGLFCMIAIVSIVLYKKQAIRRSLMSLPESLAEEIL